MLKNIDPLLTPELLHALRSMGHGDTIAIVDANFPAAATASSGPNANAVLVRLPGASATQAANAILSVLPLDDFVPQAAWCMAVVDDPDSNLPIMDEFQGLIKQHEDERFVLGKLERFAFYQEARGGEGGVRLTVTVTPSPLNVFRSLP
uniref:L-fucose mutarotase n=1 Tax=Mycena chlorophos TaxID=658473 RepID=A0ABQ0LXN1_MYCCL|nr:RbsD transport [Mycena chlorophos]